MKVHRYCVNSAKPEVTKRVDKGKQRKARVTASDNEAVQVEADKNARTSGNQAKTVRSQNKYRKPIRRRMR